MDEVDSIGSTRIESSGGGDSEVQRTMLELLNQLDGFESTKNIKVGRKSKENLRKPQKKTLNLVFPL
jgi:ATP-dependent 26S proteasome regulatory subunit